MAGEGLGGREHFNKGVGLVERDNGLSRPEAVSPRPWMKMNAADEEGLVGDWGGMVMAGGREEVIMIGVIWRFG
jgi:hypothetical protein